MPLRPYYGMHPCGYLYIIQVNRLSSYLKYFALRHIKWCYLFLFGLPIPLPFSGLCDKNYHFIENHSGRFLEIASHQILALRHMKKAPPRIWGSNTT